MRRHPNQSSFLKDAGRQIRIIKLQGFLFFGTISNVEIAVRKILDGANWSKDPIRYLVVDFSAASGVDFSAAEAFVRMQRLLDERGVVLVLCGCPFDSEVGIALRSVGLWSDAADGKVVVLENLNDALEVSWPLTASLRAYSPDAPQSSSTARMRFCAACTPGRSGLRSPRPLQETRFRLPRRSVSLIGMAAGSAGFADKSSPRMACRDAESGP